MHEMIHNTTAVGHAHLSVSPASLVNVLVLVTHAKLLFKCGSWTVFNRLRAHNTSEIRSSYVQEKS